MTKYIGDLFRAVSKLFPSTMFSTGGDELNTNCYDIDEPTQATLNSTGRTLEQALDDFTKSTHKVLQDSGKTPVVWEEMVLDHNVTLSADTKVIVWISSANVKAVAESGHKLIHGASDYFYLVRRMSTSPLLSPNRSRYPGLRAWCLGRRLPHREQLVRSLQELAALVHLRSRREPDR